MRYPVIDDFAIALAGKLYDLLAAKGRPLPRALGMALGEVAPGSPALPAGTSALFGSRAAELPLAAPCPADRALAGGAEGDRESAGRTRQCLEAMAENADLASLAGVLGRILAGERDAGLADQVDDPVAKAVVVTVLRYAGA